MANNRLSPGVAVIEKDISEFAPTIDSSVVGLVGFASKGPLNEAKLITSPQNLVDLFGKPSEDIPGQGLEAALEILEATNRLYFVRAASGTAGEASSVMPLGACPAMAVSSNGFGVTENLYLKVQVTDADGASRYPAPVSFSIPASTVDATSGSQGLALAKILGGSLDADKQGGFFDTNTDTSGFIVGSWAGSGATISVSAYSDSGFNAGSGLAVLAPLDLNGNPSGTPASAMTAYGATIVQGASGASYTVQSLYPGAGYNSGLEVDGSTSGNSVEINSLGGAFAQLVVNEDGAQKESFKVSLVTDKNFVEDEINTGNTNLRSDIIKGEIFFSGAPGDPNSVTDFINKAKTALGTSVLHARHQVEGLADSDPRFVKFIETTVGMSGGDNSIPTTDADRATHLIGDATEDPKTGMQALDDDVLNISLACVPGISNQSVQNSLITLAEQTKNFLAVVSPPYAVGSVQDAIDWTNGRSDSRTAAINSSWAAVYWPWVQVFSVFDAKDRWYDPSIFAIRQMVFTDSVSEPWFAPAGLSRGRLTKPSNVEVNLNEGDRDSLYSGGNIINPIANFTQEGIVVWGQRTAQRTPSSLDRVNVRRLMIALRKVLLQIGRPYVFEPNDELTWEELENVINPFLDDIKRRRGITEFKAVVDETTNTAARIDRNELWVKVLIKPTKTAEVIVFEVNLTNSSAEIGN